MGKKHEMKYRYCIDDDGFDACEINESYLQSYRYNGLSLVQTNHGDDGAGVLKKMLLKRNNSGVFLGVKAGCGPGTYVGIPQGTEGNIVVVGGNGSGKSAEIAKPTIKTWQGALCVTDIKGELSDFYGELYDKGVVARPYIIFDPTQLDGLSYDPFWWLLQDDSNNLVNNVQEIALAIIPLRPDEKEPFWTETERGVLAAALLYYLQLGLSFSEAICLILKQSLSSLCKELSESDNVQVQLFVGNLIDAKDETLAAIDRGLRNKIMLFATDPYISHVFRGSREGAKCFTWEDLDHCNIFLRIPPNRIEQWSGAINLLYTQLIRYLERRPEMYSPEGVNNVQTLLLMDEFARFGKLEMIVPAISTLRSKNVNICLMIQSLAQLDKIYGEYDRRIIFDNCQYQVILRANDAETQMYFCELIGTVKSVQKSAGEHTDEFLDTTSYSRQMTETRECRIFPHELSTLKDILLLTPHGFCRLDKSSVHNNIVCPEPSSDILLPYPPHELSADVVIEVESEVIPDEKICNAGMIEVQSTSEKICSAGENVIPASYDIPRFFPAKNEGAIMLSIEERSAKAEMHIADAKQKQRLEQKQKREAQKKNEQRRNFIIGELVTKYFPEVRDLEPGTKSENVTNFQPLEAFLSVLAADPELVDKIKDRARYSKPE